MLFVTYRVYIYFVLDIKSTYPVPSDNIEKKSEKPLLGDIIREANSQNKFYIGR